MPRSSCGVLPLLVALVALPGFLVAEETGPDPLKIPEVAAALKEMERASTEARIKEIGKATKKLEPLVRKLATKDVKLAAEVQNKIESLAKEASDLEDSLKDHPTRDPRKVLVGRWSAGTRVIEIDGSLNALWGGKGGIPGTIKENPAAKGTYLLAWSNGENRIIKVVGDKLNVTDAKNANSTIDYVK